MEIKFIFFCLLIYCVIESHHVEGAPPFVLDKITKEIQKITDKIHERIFPNHVHNKDCRHDHTNDETHHNDLTTEFAKMNENPDFTENLIATVPSVPDIDVRSGHNEFTETINARQARNNDVEEFDVGSARRIINVGCNTGYRPVNGRCRQIA